MWRKERAVHRQKSCHYRFKAAPCDIFIGKGFKKSTRSVSGVEKQESHSRVIIQKGRTLQDGPLNGAVKEV